MTKNDEGRTVPFAALPELAALLRRQWEHTINLEMTTGQTIPTPPSFTGTITAPSSRFTPRCSIGEGRMPVSEQGYQNVSFMNSDGRWYGIWSGQGGRVQWP